MPFYAVRKGRKPGVYQTWPECQEQIVKFPGPKFKKFPTEAEAWDFVNEGVKSTGAGLKQAQSGEKRSLSADTESDDLGPQPAKKSNVKKSEPEDSPVDYYTGKRFDEEDGVKVYIDGAFGVHGLKGARAGLGVFWGEDDSRNLSERLPGRATNNRAEIHAAKRAVEQAKTSGIKNLVLHTDSQFLINSITTWIKGWKRKDWKKATGEPVANKEDFLELDEVIQDINIKWVHVRGHQGISGNEQADKLAVQGSKKALPGE